MLIPDYRTSVANIVNSPTGAGWVWRPRLAMTVAPIAYDAPGWLFLVCRLAMTAAVNEQGPSGTTPT
jgi:hypothetical protein